jgi:hypothetical protein
MSAWNFDVKELKRQELEEPEKPRAFGIVGGSVRGMGVRATAARSDWDPMGQRQVNRRPCAAVCANWVHFPGPYRAVLTVSTDGRKGIPYLVIMNEVCSNMLSAIVTACRVG